MQAADGTARVHGGHAGPGRESRPSLAVVRGSRGARIPASPRRLGLATKWEPPRPASSPRAPGPHVAHVRGRPCFRPPLHACCCWWRRSRRGRRCPLSPAVPGGYFQLWKFSLSLVCPGCGRWCKTAVTLKSFLLLFLFILRETSPSSTRRFGEGLG